MVADAKKNTRTHYLRQDTVGNNEDTEKSSSRAFKLYHVRPFLKLSKHISESQNININISVYTRGEERPHLAGLELSTTTLHRNLLHETEPHEMAGCVPPPYVPPPYRVLYSILQKERLGLDGRVESPSGCVPVRSYRDRLSASSDILIRTLHSQFLLYM